ncbi:MAG TPA: polyprenyl synthetase family protein [Chryseolinea sp.]|nr:polyprenyl synthetase family protein [Chryseolinea sp.]
MSSLLSRYQKLIEAEISKQKYGEAPASLYEPIRYLMGLGGKRLRPMLVLLSYSLFKKDVKRIVKYATAVEAFHNFTLMHDDIMDKAPLRRGKPTVHEKWNVSTAILSGDVMLVKVYDMLLPIEPDKLKKVYTAFNKCAAEVCEGQQWDMEFEEKTFVSEDEYLDMIKLKTAVLLGFSLELGAILAGASLKDCKALREFGTNIGIGFQLKDDLLDAYGDPKKFGKQVGGDIVANKKTFLLIKALEHAKGQVKRELHGWLALRKLRNEDKVSAMKSIYDKLDIPNIAERRIDHFFKKGFGKLSTLSCSSTKSAELRQFAELLIGRQS